MPNFTSKDSQPENTQEDLKATEAAKAEDEARAEDAARTAAAEKEAADKAAAAEEAKVAEAAQATAGTSEDPEDEDCEATVAVVLDPEFAVSVAEDGEPVTVAYVSTALDDDVALTAEPTYLCPENAELVLASAAGKLHEEE